MYTYLEGRKHKKYFHKEIVKEAPYSNKLGYCVMDSVVPVGWTEYERRVQQLYSLLHLVMWWLGWRPKMWSIVISGYGCEDFHHHLTGTLSNKQIIKKTQYHNSIMCNFILYSCNSFHLKIKYFKEQLHRLYRHDWLD